MIDNHDITNIIYDTLLQNGDLHEMIDLNEVSNQEVEAHRGLISFNYKGREVTISVSSKEL